MMALFKIIRSAFLPALVLAGSIPFAFTHWMPCLGLAPAVFVFSASPAASHPESTPGQTPHHGLCWKAEDNSARTPKCVAQWESSGIGEPLVYSQGQIQIPSRSPLSSRTPDVLSILRI